MNETCACDQGSQCEKPTVIDGYCTDCVLNNVYRESCNHAAKSATKPASPLTGFPNPHFANGYYYVDRDDWMLFDPYDSIAGMPEDD